MSQLTGFHCVSQNCGWAAFHNHGKVQHQKCARCCTSMEKTPELLPPNPSPSPGRPLARRGAQGCRVHLREDVRARKFVTTSCCFVICPNQSDRMEVGRITYPIPEHAWIRQELEQRSTSGSTHTLPSQRMRGREETQIRLKLQEEKKIARTSLLVPGLNSPLEIHATWGFLFYHKCGKVD